MARRDSRIPALRQFILRRVRKHPSDIAALAIAEFGVSREWVNRILSQLVSENVLSKKGRTKAVHYSLIETSHAHSFRVMPTTEEHVIWNQFAEPLMDDVAPNVKEICFYGFNEMVNNVIDHSGAGLASVSITRSADQIEIAVLDVGIGIFEKIKRVMGMDTTRHAMFALSKGKLTTDSSRHTGEGVFFTSRAFDDFWILSSGLYFAHHRDSNDWLFEDRADEDGAGTAVFMRIDPASTFTLEQVFQDQSTQANEVGFNKTTLVLKLAQYADGPLLSRSQAKRVLSGVYRFREAVVDFTDVDTIGPAFADEIFRVYGQDHPDITIMPTNMNERCAQMVRRVRGTPPASPPRDTE